MDDDCCGGYSAVGAVSYAAVAAEVGGGAVVVAGHVAGNHRVSYYDV